MEQKNGYWKRIAIKAATPTPAANRDCATLTALEETNPLYCKEIGNCLFSIT
jgi:hypothetical protein